MILLVCDNPACSSSIKLDKVAMDQDGPPGTWQEIKGSTRPDQFLVCSQACHDVLIPPPDAAPTGEPAT